MRSILANLQPPAGISRHHGSKRARHTAREVDTLADMIGRRVDGSRHGKSLRSHRGGRMSAQAEG